MINVEKVIKNDLNDMNETEIAINRQAFGGILNKLGFASSTALALAPIRLNSAYKGACMNVRRTSDNATADILFKSGTAKWERWRDGLYNCLPNPDGRYGLVGVTAVGGVLAQIADGFRNTGDGSSQYQQLRFTGSSLPFPSPVGGKYSVRMSIKAPLDATQCFISVTNNTTTKSVNVFSQLILGQESNIIADIPILTDSGTTNAVRLFLQIDWADAATANGKVLEVKYVSPIYRGESASRPYYNTPVADLFNTVLAPYTNANGVVHPMGAMAGEMDLDQLMTFVGTSSGFVTRVYDQSTGTKVTLTNLLGNDGNFAVDSNADGLADGWTISGTLSAKSLSDNVQSFTVSSASGGVEKTIPQTSKKLYACVYVKSSSSMVALRMSGGVIAANQGTHTGSGNFEFLSAEVNGSGSGGIFLKVYDTRTSGWANIDEKLFHLLVLDDIFGTAYIPPKSWLDREIKNMIDTKGYIDTSELIRRNDAYNTTAAQQPRIVNAGVPDFGLMPYYDGSDDRLKIDNAASLDIVNAPLMLWGKGVNQAQTGYGFYRGGNGASEGQYAFYFDTAVPNATTCIIDGATYSTLANTAPSGALNSHGVVWDGATRNPIANKTELTGTVKTGSLTSRSNTLIGCRSSSADGSAGLLFWKGNIGMTLVATKDPTQGQLDKLG